ncbi:sigma-E factor negative regulatory protein [Hydrogenophaga taeniospiralis]|jgi:sigma-E factor negative regulatory protein RseA|uniref:sigma-E factor negative regulatory protein n=1 Tax=Hydrogenophaga taeniospiralis TaxID=65656 RepID=UPI001CFA0BFF|nr:sigma-E factor negative regulatory protein [Hydrogenophaga taeniospiralis]MCB4366485.1 sigma-E factor negative regulatory protein [Hydrogenophaga taeniospiralis]
MNAAREVPKSPASSVRAVEAPSQPQALDVDECGLSALVDGEIGEAELDRVLAGFAEQSDVRASWHAYQVIGDVLRSSGMAVSSQAPQAFLAGIHAKLQTETGAQRTELSTVSKHLARISPTGHPQVSAANDAVFRWKLVAGFASLAAVMAVSWTVLGNAAAGAGGGGSDGAQLALTAPESSREIAPSTQAVAATTPASGAAVVVNTTQGPVIRDAQLEALMAEHRQNGGMSALQMPAGFLRNATYDEPGR